MKKTLLILLLGIIILQGTQATTWCYQESTNTSNQVGTDTQNCGLNYNGNYTFTTNWVDNGATIDGNWSTISSGEGQTELYYYKPLGIQSVNWSIRDQDGYVNLTIPTTCVERFNDYIHLRVFSDTFGNVKRYYCNNITSGSLYQLTLRNSVGNGLYEEGIYWEIPFINLKFFYFNGTQQTTTGFYTNRTTNVGNFSGNSFNISTYSLNEGRINVRFGDNTTVYNYTQYYEFDNDLLTDKTENITLLTLADTQHWIKVIDENGNLIDDVIVRASMSKPEQGTAWKFIGQRFTGQGDRGITSFYFDSNSIVQLQFSKDGYTSVITEAFDPNTEQYTITSPLEITMRKTNYNSHGGVSITPPLWYDENINTIKISTYAPNKNTLTFYTSLDNTTNYTITLNEFKYGEYTLTNGTSYNQNRNDTLYIYLWADDTYWGNISIPYKAIISDYYNEPTGLNTDTKKKILWISIIGLVGILGLLFKGDEEGESDYGGLGKNLFYVTIIGVSVLTGLFYNLLAITMIYYALLIIKGWINE